MHRNLKRKKIENFRQVDLEAVQTIAEMGLEEQIRHKHLNKKSDQCDEQSEHIRIKIR